MTVRELIEQLQAIENRTLPVIFVDPYGDAEDEWEFDDQEPVRVGVRQVVLHLGTRIGKAEDDGENGWHAYNDDSALEDGTVN